MRSDSPRLEASQVEEVLRAAGVERIAPAAMADESVTRSDSGLLRPLAEQVARLEKAAIAAAMTATGGNKVAAAKLLGISRAKLYERLMTDDQTYA